MYGRSRSNGRSFPAKLWINDEEDDEEQGLMLLVHGHSGHNIGYNLLFLKVFFRSLFFVVLAACLAFHVVYHRYNADTSQAQARHDSKHLDQTELFSSIPKHRFSGNSVFQLSSVKPFRSQRHYDENQHVYAGNSFFQPSNVSPAGNQHHYDENQQLYVENGLFQLPNVKPPRNQDETGGYVEDRHEIIADLYHGGSRVKVSSYLRKHLDHLRHFSVLSRGHFQDPHAKTSLDEGNDRTKEVAKRVLLKKMNSFADLHSAHKSSISRLLDRKTISMRRRTRNTYSNMFQDLLREGLLNLHHNVAFIGTKSDTEEIAIKMLGFGDLININVMPNLNSDPEGGTLFRQIADASLDFAFTKAFDDSPYPTLLVSEIERILKEGGIAAMYVSLDKWRTRFLSSGPGPGIKPVTLLFGNSEIVYVTSARAPGFDTLIVFKKNKPLERSPIDLGNSDGKKSLLTSQVIATYRQQREEYKTCRMEYIQSIGYVPDLWYLTKNEQEPYVFVPVELSDHVRSCFRSQYSKNLENYNRTTVLSNDVGAVPFIMFSESTEWLNVIERVLSSGQSDYKIQVGVKKEVLTLHIQLSHSSSIQMGIIGRSGVYQMGLST